jgi:hypothetical protein
MQKALLACGLGLFVSAGLLGCGSEGGGGDDSTPTPDQIGQKHDFTPGQGQPGTDALAYPKGPYGIGKGSIIANYKFVGLPNSQASGDLFGIQLADFYNPDGVSVYPENHPMGAGKPKPKVLLIDVASVWCGPCNYEADQVLPPLYAKYHPKGGEFLLQLADGPTPGIAAEPKHLYNWTKKYAVDYPATIDPSYKLGALFEADAFPANMIIDTTTMTIVEVIAGAPEAGGAFWKKYESLLNP